MSEPLDPRASTTLYQAPVGQAVCLPALSLTTTFRFEENDIMTMTNDLDAINADLMGGSARARSAATPSRVIRSAARSSR
ncbi:hypothetical protein [Nocardia testacea]|uniref:hypothetical protein n=1 Tax=Nocardia testacea TaxID=248551 RepID=UPI003A8B6D64